MALGACIGQWEHSILHSEQAAARGDAFCKVLVAGLGPTLLQIEALPDESVRSLRPRIAAQLGLCAELDLVLVCGGEVLRDGCLVSQLPELRVHCVWIRTTHYERMPTEFQGSRCCRAGGTMLDGKIFVAPWWTGKVLEIDIATEDILQLGDEIQGEDLYVASGVVSRDGSLYFAPANASSVLCVRPESGVVEKISIDVEGGRKYVSPGVLAPNGLIYFAPAFADQVLRIDPALQLATPIGPEFPGYNKYLAAGAVSTTLAFFAPHWATKVLCIDLEADAVAVLEPELSGDDRYKLDGVVSESGDIYFVPEKTGKVLRITPSTRSVATLAPEEEGYSNIIQLAGGVLTPSGKVYFAPYHAGSYNAGKVLTILGENTAPDLRISSPRGPRVRKLE